MIESRIKTAHIYDEENAKEIVKKIYNDYYRLLVGLKEAMENQLAK